MAVGDVESHIAGVESACRGTVNAGTLNIAVAEVLNTHCHGSMLTHTLAVAQAGEIGLAYIAHIVDTHLVVKLGSQQGRVLLNQVDVIVDDSEVVTTQAINVA